jgi:hypothetical protein
MVCPLCGHDDEVVREPVAPGIWRYTCTGGRSHSDPIVWERDAVGAELPQWGGITAELGLYDDLPFCLTAREPFVEYGIVEHRYAELRPEVFRQLVERYGRTRIAPASFTATSFIALALWRLVEVGLIVQHPGQATGHWTYNGTMYYYALPQEQHDDRMLSWKEYAAAHHLDA